MPLKQKTAINTQEPDSLFEIQTCEVQGLFPFV